MAQSPIMYEWECPICGATRISMTHCTTSPIADEAEAAIVSHVEQTAGNGHGEAGEIPPAVDEAELTDFIWFKERFGGQAAPG